MNDNGSSGILSLSESIDVKIKEMSWLDGGYQEICGGRMDHSSVWTMGAMAGPAINVNPLKTDYCPSLVLTIIINVYTQH